jgi:Kef-type K+ transport system membrane component KefB
MRGRSGGGRMPPLLIWLVQLALIVGAARAAGWVAVRLRQPRVVGEMAAGILLGPSLLGWLAPDLSLRLLGPDMLGGLTALSQLGLLLFMFLVGLELEPQLLRRSGPAVVAISLVSILAPFALGAGLALALAPQLAAPGVPPAHVAIFLGTALSVTAFPVLMRILGERGLLRTRLGALVIACAAADDIIAWCLLAGVVILIESAGAPIWQMLLGVAAFCALMLTVGRAIARRALSGPGGLTHARLAGILLAVVASAATTEWLGVHALFGAFLAGAIMPRDELLVRQLQERLEDLTVVFLLPLFFASAGLRTDIGLLAGDLWLVAALILAAAVVGKLGGAAIAARASGMPWGESLAVGALMNTRGLMELVVASVGLEIGVISPAVFTILVIVALVTTCMTGPLLTALRVARASGAAHHDERGVEGALP